MKKWIAALLTVVGVLLFSACSAREEEAGYDIQLYCIDNTESTLIVRGYDLKAEQPEEQVEEVLKVLAMVPEKLEYKAPLAMGFGVLGYELESGALSLNVDSDYQKLSNTSEVLVRGALVSTLCQLEGVEQVAVTVEGSPLYDALGNPIGVMQANQFIHNPGKEIGNYETVYLTLYFTNAEGTGLIAVNREKGYNTNIALDKLVVEELLAGPSAAVSGVYPTINPATKVISVLTKDGICYVNLSAEFLNQVTKATADVTMYSIINSLSELNTVEKVQIAIDGDTTGTYREKYSFGSVYEANLDLVTTVEESEKEGSH